MIYLWLEVLSTWDSPFSDCLCDRRVRFCHPSSHRSIRMTINVLSSAIQRRKLRVCINRHRYPRVRICQFSADIATSSYNNRRSEIKEVQHPVIRMFVCKVYNMSGENLSFIPQTAPSVLSSTFLSSNHLMVSQYNFLSHNFFFAFEFSHVSGRSLRSVPKYRMSIVNQDSL